MFPGKSDRSRSEGNKNRSLEANMAHTNEVFDINTELPDNPLYLSSQPLDELGYSSNHDQEKQHDLPPTDSKSETKIISNYDVPPNNKPIDNNESSMPVYAVPKKKQSTNACGQYWRRLCACVLIKQKHCANFGTKP